MAELNLIQIFGTNATQNDTTLIIQKSDLPLLTPSANNTPESLLIAILLKALSNFSGNILDGNGLPILDSNNQPITFDNSKAYDSLKIFFWNPYGFTRNNQPYIMHQIIVFSYAQI